MTAGDDSRGAGRIGVLVPFTNTNLEPDMALLRPPGISLHFARLGGYDEEAVPDAAQMAGLGARALDEPLRLLAGVRPDVVLYGCTSATLAHGAAFDRDLAARIADMMGAPGITAAGALVEALRRRGVTRIGFASPYVPELNDRAIAFLSESGFQTVARADVEETLDNTGQGAMPPSEVEALGARADAPEAEAIVLSCTDMRAVEIAEALSGRLGKPVICSNAAMMEAARLTLGLA